MASFTFIVSVQDLIPPLMAGGSIYIMEERERKNVDMLLSGEKSQGSYPNDGNLIEVYGSSETACVLFHRVGQEDSRFLGKPCSGVKVYLLDDDGKEIREAGKTGELCITSPWPTLGYNHLPNEMEARFTYCPFEPEKIMYHSGDYMSWDEDGNLLFHGRKDRMVKLRGYRVELGEIEQVMRKLDTLKEIACIALKISKCDKICCYYTGKETDSAVLKAHAAAFLPDYMVPDYFVRLDEMPRNERNKVNYLALKEMEPPIDETETEKRICSAFAKALELQRVSVEGDSFDLGSTSLSAAVLIANLGDLRKGLSFQE